MHGKSCPARWPQSSGQTKLKPCKWLCTQYIINIPHPISHLPRHPSRPPLRMHNKQRLICQMVASAFPLHPTALHHPHPTPHLMQKTASCRLLFIHGTAVELQRGRERTRCKIPYRKWWRSWGKVQKQSQNGENFFWEDENGDSDSGDII